MWTGYSPGCIVFFYFFWLHSGLNGKKITLSITIINEIILFTERGRHAFQLGFSYKTAPFIKCIETTFSFTLQTLLVVWGLKGQCLGCLRGGAFYPSCILNNREENFLLRSAPHDQYPSCHLQGEIQMC